MNNARIWFRKFNEAIYISHLDLNRTMIHALNASGLKVWHTEGFNPHPFVTFALPLSLGITGLNESLDVRFVSETEKEKVITSLNMFLPESIRVFDVTQPQMKPKDIFMAIFKITFEENVLYDLKKFFSQTSIMVLKKTKSGTKEINLKEQIFSYNIDVQDGNVILFLDLPAGNDKNINPFLFTTEFGHAFSDITRVGLFDKEFNAFK